MLSTRAASMAVVVGLTTLGALVTPALGQELLWDVEPSGDECFRVLQVGDLPDLTVVDEHIERAVAQLFGGDAPPLTYWREERVLVLRGTKSAVDCLAQALARLELLAEAVAPPVAEYIQVLRISDWVERAEVEDLVMEVAVMTSPPLRHRFLDRLLVVWGTQGGIECLAAILAHEGMLYQAEEPVCETVQLYYARDATNVQALLETVRETFAPAVTVSASASSGALPALVAAGPREQVEDLKRVIAAIDVPHPQVRMKLSAFQLSGRNAARVAEHAKIAHREVAAVARLIRGYLHQLEAYALDEQVRQEAEVEAARERLLSEAREETQRQDGPFQIMMDVATVAGPRVVLIPSKRGRHPLSLTETIATLILLPPSGTKTLGDSIAEELRGRLQTWVAGLQAEDTEALKVWLELPGADEHEPRKGVATWLETLEAAEADGDKAEPVRRKALDALLPDHFLGTLQDEEYVAVIQEAIGGFLQDYRRQAQNWRSVSPDRLRREAADVQAVLQDTERALGEDIERIFIAPLLDELGTLASSGASGGLGSTSNITITVLSGVQAHVVGSAVSYFDVSQPAKLDEATLGQAQSIATALGAALPAPSGGRPGLVLVAVPLDKEKVPDEDGLTTWSEYLTGALTGLQVLAVPASHSLALTGTAQQVESAVAILTAVGVVEGAKPPAQPVEVVAPTRPRIEPLSALGGGLGGIPMERLLALGLALGQEREVWSSLTEGADLTFRPYVLPGGARAELEIVATVTHDAPSTEGAEGTTIPLSRVAKHEATTSVYVDSMDLFALSSFNLRTCHPRGDFVVPVLGQIPILGKIFRFPRKARTVHHESILLINSTILPTGMDLGALLDFGEISSSEAAEE